MLSKPATPGLCLTISLILAGAASAQDASHDASKPDDDTVVVTAKKDKVKRRVDATVYDTSQSPEGQAGTAADVLKTVPSVSVSAEGQVRLRGDANVQVYINGKPAAEMAPESRAATLLTMPGGDIASVEVITNPSARYDGNGGGIINIVLKKNRKPGAGGTVAANSADFGRYNATASSHDSHGRLSLNMTLAYRHDGSLRLQGSDTGWLDPSGSLRGRSVQASRAFVRRVTSSATAGLDYDLGEAGTLGLGLRHAEHHSRNRITEMHQDYDATGGLLDDYDRLSSGPNTQSDDSATLTWSRHYDDGSELKLQAVRSVSLTTRDKSYHNRFRAPVQSDSGDRLLYRLGRRVSGLSGDYVRPYSDDAQVSAGFDLEDESDPAWNAHAAADPATGDTIPGTATEDRFQVRRHLTAGYVTWQDSFGPWTLLAGTRLEALRTTAGELASHYGNLNPSLHVSYTVDGQRQIKASFSRSLQRPDALALNPAIIYVDAQNSTAGNPDLKPQRVSAAELEYDYTTDPLTWSVTLYDRASAGTVTDYGVFTTGNVLVTTKRNAGRGHSLGVDYNVSGWRGEHLNYRFDLNLFHIRLETADAGGLLRQAALAWSTQAGLDYDSGHGDSLSIDAGATGDSLTSQGERSGISSLDVVWTHSLSPRLNLVVSAYNILGTSRQTFTTTTSALRQAGYSDMRNRIVFAGLRWTLGS